MHGKPVFRIGWFRGSVRLVHLASSLPPSTIDGTNRCSILRPLFQLDCERPGPVIGDHRQTDTIPALRRSRQDLNQREWLEAIPESVSSNRSVLNMARVGARMVTGDVEGVEAASSTTSRLGSTPMVGSAT